MRAQYDFSTAKRNPYAKRLRQPVTIRLEQTTIDYFRRLAQSTGLAYQSLINLYLRDCVSSGRRPALAWSSRTGRGQKAEPSGSATGARRGVQPRRRSGARRASRS